MAQRVNRSNIEFFQFKTEKWQFNSFMFDSLEFDQFKSNYFCSKKNCSQKFKIRKNRPTGFN